MKQRIWDRVRGKWLLLTPEEAVRRQVLEFLCAGAEAGGPGIPVTSIAQEYSFKIHGGFHRADIVVFGHDAKPLLLVECKAPYVHISSGTLIQAFRYNDILGARFVMLTNGSRHYVYEVSKEGKYLALKAFPDLREWL